MTARVVLSPEARGASDAIITGLAHDAGFAVAQGDVGRFDAAHNVLTDHPDIGRGDPGSGPASGSRSSRPSS